MVHYPISMAVCEKRCRAIPGEVKQSAFIGAEDVLGNGDIQGSFLPLKSSNLQQKPGDRRYGVPAPSLLLPLTPTSAKMLACLEQHEHLWRVIVTMPSIAAMVEPNSFLITPITTTLSASFAGHVPESPCG